jgi:hypothetical protein
MRIAVKLLLGAVLCTGLATLETMPAAAVDHEFGSVNISSTGYTDVLWNRFGGPVDHVTFMPVNDAVNCEHISLIYADGAVHQVFSGYIAQGQHTTITLPPPNPGDVREVRFSCRAEKMDGAKISLAATTEGWPRDWESAWDEAHPAHVTTQARAE